MINSARAQLPDGCQVGVEILNLRPEPSLRGSLAWGSLSKLGTYIINEGFSASVADFLPKEISALVQRLDLIYPTPVRSAPKIRQRITCS